MKIVYSLALFIGLLPLAAQEGCKLPRPYKHNSIIPIFASEHAGVYLNAHNVSLRQFQVETSSLFSSLSGSYNDPVFTALFAARYGLSNATEVNFRWGILNPTELNSDTLYNTSLSLGFKVKLFNYIGPKFKWKGAVALNSSVCKSTHFNNEVNTPIRFDISLNNSIQLYKIIHYDLSIGIYSLYAVDQTVHGKLSSRLLLKDEYSKIGLFFGISGNQYYESIINIGLEISNNRNYILLLSIGTLDKGAAPNIAFSYRF